MKRMFVLFVIGVIVLSYVSCSRNGDNGCTNVSLAQDSTTIVNYMAANGYTGYTKDPGTGTYYKVIAPGTAPVVTTSSRVYIRYKGNLLNATSTVFDSTCSITVCPTTGQGYQATGFIAGFQVLLSKIAKGGIVDGFVPSNYAYGCQGVGIIPANSSLHFYVELVDVQ